MLVLKLASAWAKAEVEAFLDGAIVAVGEGVVECNL